MSRGELPSRGDTEKPTSNSSEASTSVAAKDFATVVDDVYAQSDEQLAQLDDPVERIDATLPGKYAEVEPQEIYTNALGDAPDRQLMQSAFNKDLAGADKFLRDMGESIFSDEMAETMADRMERSLQEQLPLIKFLADKSGIPVAVIAAIMDIESKGNPNIMSFGGAAGYFQHIFNTALAGGQRVVCKRDELQGERDCGVLIDTTYYDVKRHGDYENGGLYYPAEDERLGMAHWPATANIMSIKFNKQHRSWLDMAAYYHSAKNFSEGSDLVSYLKKQAENKATPGYVKMFAKRIQAASKINWEQVDNFEFPYKTFKVEEPVSLYELLYTNQDYTIETFLSDEYPSINLNNQLSLFRIPLGALGTDLKIPSAYKMQLDSHFMVRRWDKKDKKWKPYSANTGFYHQANEGIGAKIYTNNNDGTYTLHSAAFSNAYKQEDLNAWRKGAEFVDTDTFDSSASGPEFAREARGTKYPPTIDDLRRAGIPMVEIIRANPTIFGLDDSQSIDPAIRRYLETTYLRKGYELEVPEGVAPLFGGKGTNVVQKYTPEQRSELAGVDEKMRRNLWSALFHENPKITLNDFIQDYEAALTTGHLWYKKVAPHPTKELFEQSASSEKHQIDHIINDPTVYLKWTNDFLLPELHSMMKHSTSLTVDEVYFAVTAMRFFQFGLWKREIANSPGFIASFLKMKSYYNRILKVEEMKIVEVENLENLRREGKFNEVRITKSKMSFREDNEQKEVMSMLYNTRIQEGIMNEELLMFAHDAYKLAEQQIEKFQPIGLKLDGMDFDKKNEHYTGIVRFELSIQEKDGSSVQIARMVYDMRRGYDSFDVEGIIVASSQEGSGAKFSTARLDGGSNVDIETLKAEHLNDALFQYVKYCMVIDTGSRNVSGIENAKYGKNGEYLVFTNENMAAYYAMLINPANEGMLEDEFIGSFYINIFSSLEAMGKNDDSQIDGNFITLTTKKWKLEDGKVVRDTDEDGKKLPEVVLGRYKTIEDLKQAIADAQFILRPSTE